MHALTAIRASLQECAPYLCVHACMHACLLLSKLTPVCAPQRKLAYIYMSVYVLYMYTCFCRSEHGISRIRHLMYVLSCHILPWSLHCRENLPCTHVCMHACMHVYTCAREQTFMYVCCCWSWLLCVHRRRNLSTHHVSGVTSTDFSGITCVSYVYACLHAFMYMCYTV
jgi:hypothetical protein